MRTPGFTNRLAPKSGDSLKWLARKIVADPRFAEATVKFWWPAIMGSEVAEPPAEEGDADFEGQLLAANAQSAEVRRLAEGSGRASTVGSRYNLKDLLVEIVLSKWFRADALGVRGPGARGRAARCRRPPAADAGGAGAKDRRPDWYQWGRDIDVGCKGEIAMRSPTA